MYGVLSLNPDEQLLCLFFRGQGDSVNTLETADFERRMELKPKPEGGLSFYRAETTTFREIVDNVKRKGKLNRGIATVGVKQLTDLGFKICGDLSVDDKHVCIHCSTCNLSKSECTPESGCSCGFITPENYYAENDRLRKALSEEMKVVVEATNSRDELLNIFTKDLEGNPKTINQEYERRWRAERQKQQRGSEGISR